MTRRRPLPNHALQAIDVALCENSQAVRALLPLMSGRAVTQEEHYRLVGQAIHHLHESTAALKEARITNLFLEAAAQEADHV